MVRGVLSSCQVSTWIQRPREFSCFTRFLNYIHSCNSDMAFDATNCTLPFGNISNAACNETRARPDAEVPQYDSLGALHFIVAVIVVYGVAVVGVFLIGHFRRSKKRENQEVDKQAHLFLKQMPEVRESLEKKRRLNSIQQLLPNRQSCVNTKKQITHGEDMFKYIALPIIASESKVTNQKPSYNQDIESGLGYIGTVNERASSDASWSDVIKEVDEVASDDLDDDVFMNSRERNSFGVDIYLKK